MSSLYPAIEPYGSELIVVDEAGHGAGEPGIEQAVLSAIDRFKP